MNNQNTDRNTEQKADLATNPAAGGFVLIRHGQYLQQENTPSALQLWPLTEEGIQQANEAAETLLHWRDELDLYFSPVIHCSTSLRAWQTACIIKDRLEQDFGHKLPNGVQIHSTPDLCERSVGAAANLTIAQIESILKDDPRYEVPPAGWKSSADYCLPFGGAESLKQAGQRVASHIQSALAAPDCAKGLVQIFVGHGASFRHAMVNMGLLQSAQLPGLSMYHATPLLWLRDEDGEGWHQTLGSWKIRQKSEPSD